MSSVRHAFNAEREGTKSLACVRHEEIAWPMGRGSFQGALIVASKYVAGVTRPPWNGINQVCLEKKRSTTLAASRAGRPVFASRQHQLELTSASTSSPRRMIVW